jgi:uncharacterized membrane protein YhhN
VRLSAVDLPALVLAVCIAALICGALAWANRGDDVRRGWITAGITLAVMVAIGALDLIREQPRETHFATLVFGAAIPLLGANGFILATRRTRPAVRWTLLYVVTLLLLFAGLLFGATIVPRWLP